MRPSLREGTPFSSKRCVPRLQGITGNTALGDQEAGRGGRRAVGAGGRAGARWEAVGASVRRSGAQWTGCTRMRISVHATMTAAPTKVQTSGTSANSSQPKAAANTIWR